LNRLDEYVNQPKRGRPDPEPLAVLARMIRIGGHLAGSVRDNLRRTGLKPWEFDVLAALHRAGPPHTLNPKDLVFTAMVGGATMTHRVDKLVERSLVTRSVDPGNRRRLQITLTPAGLELIEAIIADHSDNADRFLNALSASEQKTLSGLLQKVLVSHGDTHS
jgi:DNA-binding MarR family transcriptional regulator